jgi:hypothetical protein
MSSNRRWGPREARLRRWWYSRPRDAQIEAALFLGALPLAYLAACAVLAL